jgi:hypothetical protein
VSGGIRPLHSVLENGSIFYSRDGRYLDGGGSTTKLAVIENKYVTRVTKFGTEYEKYINTSGVLGNQFFVLQTKKDKDYHTNKVIGKSCSGRGPCSNVYERAYGTEVWVFDMPSGSLSKFVYKSALRRMDRVLGSSNGIVYVQFSNGDIGSFSSLGILNGIDTVSILHAAAPAIAKVIPYRHGLLAYNKNSAFWSNNASQVVSGSDVTKIYSGTRNISSFLNYGGDRATESSVRANASRGLIAAFEDGYIYFSPDGNNISGGGNTREIVRPFDTNVLKRQFFAYFTSLKSQGIVWESPIFPGEFLSVATGHKITLKNMSVRLMNRGASEDYAKNPIVLNGSGNSYVTSMVSDFGGNFVNVNVSDKGWDGIEYKWRNRGERYGVFSHEVDGAFVERPEIRITATNSCVIAATYEDTNYSGDAVGKTWNLNADFTLANNSGGQSAMNDFFVSGGQNYPWSTDLLTRELGRLPSNFTFMQAITWSVYHVNNVLFDLAGYPMKGIDITYMDID